MGGEDTSHLAPDLGLILALLRTVRVWSQARLASEAGIPPGSISQYESGKKLPELSSLMRMLDAMGFGFADIDRARAFLLSLRLGRPADESRQTNVAVTGEPSESLSEQIASMTSEAGAAVSRLMDAISLLIRERPCAHRRQETDREYGREVRLGIPSSADRAGAADLLLRLQRYPSSLQEILVRESPDFQNWAFCELLCLESERQAANDVAAAVHLATLAVRIAELAPGDEPWRFRLQGYAWAFWGNALRVQGNLRDSEKAFRRSDDLSQAGSHCKISLLEQARLLDLKASLLRSQRHLAESLELLDRALEADRRGSLTGHLLIKRAKTLEEMGDLEQAVAVLEEAETFVDPDRDPKLFAWLQHNHIDYLSKLERYAEAESLLPRVKELYRRMDNELNSLRLRWVEGRIENGLGRTDRGIEILTQVRAEFVNRSMAYDTALVSLELAMILAREGKPERVKTLARHMAPIFQAQAVHREALAALALFRRAAENEKLTVDLARYLLEYLHRARHDPELRFEAPI